ncbi:hypothetical protein HYN43_024335 [Mucilaginibacter celer]|uniref:Uncharacterized protein n=1 Tax=Mucilaginibacter celer TaxID=2305508 RepID=A0A494W3T5_9SPHI|nr:hypothetical protein HYN43_024335 [Mucilaginibacter celer]
MSYEHALKSFETQSVLIFMVSSFVRGLDLLYLHKIPTNLHPSLRGTKQSRTIQGGPACVRLLRSSQ